MQFLMNLKVDDCCKTPTNEKLISFSTKSCKVHQILDRLKIWSLKSRAIMEKTRLNSSSGGSPGRAILMRVSPSVNILSLAYLLQDHWSDL